MLILFTAKSRDMCRNLRLLTFHRPVCALKPFIFNSYQIVTHARD